jgi:molybdopterin-guanine dinucleotide biosynthesis protein
MTPTRLELSQRQEESDQLMKQRPTIVAVSGFSSNVGKTTLVCELLRQLPGWEAIKLTRGHYRSCGRDPAGCCVSDLLRDKPVVRSGYAANYQSGKDTGRFWEAGAANVHWVIVKDDQVEQGITEALSCVEAEGVVVEGNSFLEYVAPDLAVMCARAEGGKIKPSGRRALAKSDFLYLTTLSATAEKAKEQFEDFRGGLTIKLDLDALQIITREDLPLLLSTIYRREYLAQPVSSFPSVAIAAKDHRLPEHCPPAKRE